MFLGEVAFQTLLLAEPSEARGCSIISAVSCESLDPLDTVFPYLMYCAALLSNKLLIIKQISLLTGTSLTNGFSHPFQQFPT